MSEKEGKKKSVAVGECLGMWDVNLAGASLRERGARGECLGMACLVSLENFLANLSGSGDLSHPLRVRVLFSGTELSIQF